ncbi:MAG: hypothetical protein EHJ95_06875 [Methanobacteriota archaeon]|nr:MAG: hypothetical protein EHJ95_06875 [Euryarchaeota archaeon]
MKTKTFKIGEYMKGGVCVVEIRGQDITIIAKEWDFSTGSKKSSDQSNAKEFDRFEINSGDYLAYRKMYDFLINLMTHYYSEQILNYIKEHVNLIMA